MKLNKAHLKRLRHIFSINDGDVLLRSIRKDRMIMESTVNEGWSSSAQFVMWDGKQFYMRWSVWPDLAELKKLYLKMIKYNRSTVREDKP